MSDYSLLALNPRENFLCEMALESKLGLRIRNPLKIMWLGKSVTGELGTITKKRFYTRKAGTLSHSARERQKRFSLHDDAALVKMNESD